MRLHYTLQTNDYMQYYLHHDSQNNKGRNKIVTICADILFIAALLSQSSGSYVVVCYFLLLAVVIAVVWPSRLKDSIFKDTLKLVRKIDKDVGATLVIEEDSIESTTENTNFKCTINQLEKITEVKIGFYLLLKANHTIIIPKTDEINTQEVMNELLRIAKEIDIQYEDHLDWKW